MKYSKTEQMLIELTEIRQFILGTMDDAQGNPLQLWYSPRKREFSLHFLGTLVSDERLIECLLKAQKVAVSIWNEKNNDNVVFFPDLYNRVGDYAIRQEAMRQIADLESKLNALKMAYQIK